MIRNYLLVSLAALGIAACSATTQGAATGAAMGAAAGAIIGNNTGSGDAETGAIIGGVVGGAAGAYAGCRYEGGCRWNQSNNNHSQLYYDRAAGREYYFDQRDGCTYWRNGQFRSC